MHFKSPCRLLFFFLCDRFISSLSRSQLLVGAHGGMLRLFDLSTYKLTHDGFFGCYTGTSMIGACCSPDGQIIASGAQVKSQARIPLGGLSIFQFRHDFLCFTFLITHSEWFYIVAAETYSLYY